MNNTINFPATSSNIRNLEGDDSTYNDNETVILSARYVSLVSSIVVLFPILTYLLFKRQHSNRLPLYMCFSALGLSVCGFVGSYRQDVTCFYEALGIEFFGVSTIMWWLCISFNFYQVAVKEKTSADLLILERKYNYFVWFYSFLLTSITAAMGKLSTSHDGSWECWIDDVPSQWIYYYGHMALALFVGLLFWPSSLYRIWMLHWRKTLDHRILNYVRHVLFIVLFSTFVASVLIFRIFNEIHPDGASRALTILHMLAVCSPGTSLTVVFGLSKENMKIWRRAICRYSILSSSDDSSSLLSQYSPTTSTSRPSKLKTKPTHLSQNGIQFEYPSATPTPIGGRVTVGGGTRIPEQQLTDGSNLASSSFPRDPSLTNQTPYSATDISAITNFSHYQQSRRLQSRLDAVHINYKEDYYNYNNSNSYDGERSRSQSFSQNQQNTTTTNSQIIRPCTPPFERRDSEKSMSQPLLDS